MAERTPLRQASLRMFRECLKLKRGERVAVVDDGAQPAIAKAMLEAAKELGGKPQLVKIRSGREASSPIPEASKILLQSNVIAAPTRSSITHSLETTEARKAHGSRVASLPGVTEEMFIKAMSGDFEKVRKFTRTLAKYLEKPRSIWIRSVNGTNVKLNVQGRPWIVDDGDISKPGAVSNIPFGELYCAPRETVGQGEISADWWWEKIKPSTRAKLYLRNGRISGWNPPAAPLVRALQAAGTCGFVIGEFGFGTNPEHKVPIGNILYDEKIFGTAHVAFGMNTSFGGKNECKIHEDVMLLKPTVYVDEKIILEKGVYVPKELKL